MILGNRMACSSTAPQGLEVSEESCPALPFSNVSPTGKLAQQLSQNFSPANQMLQDNKLASHGKQVTNDNRSQIPSLNPQAQQHQHQQQQQQGAASHLGPKYAGGRHGVKASQISPCNPRLKAASQSLSGVGTMLKTKSKRERTVATDDAESRTTVPPSLDTDAKGESVMRSKRRCVLEKKQPYSGDEWCSGPDTEDEDKQHTTIIRERGLGGAMQGPSTGTMSEVRGPVVECGIGLGLKAELPHNQQQIAYVFTTSLANSAAEAVLKGQTDSILLFHQQNVAVTKLGQGHSSGKLPNVSEKMSSSSATGTTKTQSVTPQPASTGAGGILHPVSTPSSAGHSDSESTQIRLGGVSSNNNISTHMVEGGSVAPCPGNGDEDGGVGSNVPVGSPSSNPSIISAHYQSETGQRSGPENSDCLSKEQLEHRERSLQTLRDIERLFLRSGAGGCPRDAGDTNDNPSNSSSNPSNNYNNNSSGVLDSSDNDISNSRNCGNGHMLSSALAPMEGMKRYEEPLQSMLSQTQPLVGPPLDNPQIDSHNNLPHLPHHQLASPGVDMVPFPGPEGLTPEQIAWRKLQEQYYLEKRRQQEMQPRVHPQHIRMMPEIGMTGGPMMLRGPPPPYHSKPGGQQWGPVNIMGGGLGGNARLMEMHHDGPRGPRFLGPIQRGPPGGGGFPNSAGDLLSVRGQRPQMPPRPGMIWLDDVPNNIGSGGRFHGIYPSGPAQHLQSDTEHLLTQEEVFRIMQKRQGLPRFELERLIKIQQQGNIGSRLLDNPGGLDILNVGIGQCPPSSHVDSMDFPVPQELMHSTGGGPQRRDFVDSSLRSNLIMSMNPQINAPQQQQVMLSQKLLGGPIGERPLDEMLSPGEISQIRRSQNERGGTKVMMQGHESSLQLPNQSPFSEEQIGGSYLQQPGPGLFGADQQSPEQIGATSRLSHMSMPDGLRVTDLSPRQSLELSTSVDTINTSSVPPHQLKSPSINQEPSPLLPSPTAPGLKSPSQGSAGHHPPLPPASGAGTPSSSIRSPQVLGSSNLVLHSPSASPRQLKSPAITAAVSSPGWVSPKTALSSPGGPPSSRLTGSGGHGSTETGQSLPPRSLNSTPISQPVTMNPTLPFTSASKVAASQNPLSLIMSQMSKYAMPSSTPLYHDAIKTIASSDDEMLPDRPLLAGVNVEGVMENSPTSQVLISQSSIGGHSGPQSPMCVVSQSQPQLSHETLRPMLSSPNHMGMPTMSAPMMGGGLADGMGPCNASPISQSQMTGFAGIQHQTHDSLNSPVGGMSQNFPQLNDEGIPPQRLHLLGKGHPLQCPTHSSESCTSMTMDDGPDLSEVMRPTRTGIPEFDLSRIIPSDKPSSTLQYFPKSDQHQNPHPGPQQNTPQQLLKQLSSASLSQSSGPSPNPHLANLQNMMAEQQLQSYPSHAHQSMASQNMVSSGGMGSMDHMMGRTGLVSQQQLQQQQAMMANSHHHPSNAYPGMMPSQQHPHNLMVQQNMMMMQAKQRAMSVPGDPFGSQGPLMSAQGPMMAHFQSQSGVIGPQSLRQRGMSMESQIGYGPGRMANMPF